MSRYRLIIATLSSALLLGATACGASSHNDLVNGASPEYSDLTLLYYDGTTASAQKTSDATTAKRVVAQLSAVSATRAPNWSIDDVTMPLYGIVIGTQAGVNITAAWSNGYWIDQNGMAYKYDFDFAKLADDSGWDSRTMFPDSGSVFDLLINFPNIRWLVQDQTGWRTQLLAPANSLEPTPGFSMTLQEWTATTVSVTLTNQSTTDWSIDSSFWVQVQLDGIWYYIPPLPRLYYASYPDTLKPGSAITKTYQLDPYSDLPPGHYRLAKDDLTVEHTISG